MPTPPARLGQAPLQDSFGREIKSLRISVTDRCNFRCIYCIPNENIEWLPKAELLTFEEIVRLARIAIGLGVSKLRLTGGEPLLRKNLPFLVEELAALPGLEGLALTTNATELTRLAKPLAKAGLERVNISLDTLDRENFARMAQRDALPRVLEGIDAAVAAGLQPISINCVVIRGMNDHEVLDFADLARTRGFEVRFIEFMPLEHGQRWGEHALVPGKELRERVEERYPLDASPEQDPHSPSRDWVFRDGAPGTLGFIDSVTAPFCAECNRIRLTADGKIRTCLFSLREHDLLAALRSGEDDAQVSDRLRAAVKTKELKHHITDGLFVKPERTMSQIGG
jgi:cyclic pyranopterin phosphate synthase